jgi:hypothetical protein
MAEERGLLFTKSKLTPLLHTHYTVTLPSQHFLLKLPSENQKLILIYNCYSNDLYPVDG